MRRNPANAQRLDSDYVESEWLSFAEKRSEALQAITAMVRAHNTESLKLGVNPAYDFLLHNKEFESLRTQVGVYQAAKRSN